MYLFLDPFSYPPADFSTQDIKYSTDGESLLITDKTKLCVCYEHDQRQVSGFGLTSISESESESGMGTGSDARYSEGYEDGDMSVRGLEALEREAGESG